MRETVCRRMQPIPFPGCRRLRTITEIKEETWRLQTMDGRTDRHGRHMRGPVQGRLHSHVGEGWGWRGRYARGDEVQRDFRHWVWGSGKASEMGRNDAFVILLSSENHPRKNDWNERFVFMTIFLKAGFRILFARGNKSRRCFCSKWLLRFTLCSIIVPVIVKS